MILNLTELSPRPLYEQISSQLSDRIRNGELKPGASLLPVRILARKQRINVSTVKRAYEILQQDGLILSNGESSYQVAPLKPDRKKSSGIRARFAINDDSLNSQRLHQEFEMARRIQTELLPKPLPKKLGFSIEGYIEPSYEIGGDFYNIIPLGKERWGLVIGDACGKGLPAALLAAQTQAVVTSEMRHKQKLKEIMYNVNEHIFSSTPADTFVTMVCGIFNKIDHEFTYCTAGHEYPLLLRKEGNIESLKGSGPGVGMIKNSGYEINRIKVHRQDMIFMFTDGITEIRDRHSDEYGVERLVEILHRTIKQEPGKVIEQVLTDLRSFSSNAAEDDRTILIMRVDDE
ncbi:MAG: SpoIIE family protein phosphatase [bacterium]